ncbi:hypothetical protein EUX98_g5813 [Antrodiella citrinella]|uniref:Uncharacterized protein n=1 Tax=Antrodiella citrinella TaxID=2447956 RepID=A0A4S4MY95_9APHY|nr:hypothetical protein EUX98_g5813 [Antrodiella citrinella]
MHLFTGNEPSLQDEPSKVWMDLQKGDIPLKWQSVDMPLAAGPYYTYFIRPTKPTPCSDETPGLSSPLSNTSVWDDAPACIARARLLLQAILQDHWAGSFLVDEITVLAWLGVGNRKSPTPLPAKTRKVAILCLGADVELTLVPLNGFHSRAPDASTTHVEVQTLPTLDLPNSVEIDVEGYDPMDEDGDELIGAGLLQDAHSISVPSIKPVSVTSMPSKKDDVLFLTLVHGDLALLEGDDFNWTMRRTGMSMVLIAS